MHLSDAWIAVLVTGAAGAAAMAVAAAVVRREVTALQRSLRPLRLSRDRRPR